MPLTLVLLGLLITACHAAPTTYDQRQDGDVNVKVDLDNFVVLIARPISALDVFGAMGQLLADSKNSQQMPEPKETELKIRIEESRNNVVPVLAALAPAAAGDAETSSQPATDEATSPVAVQQTAEPDKEARSLEHPVLKVKSRESKDKAKAISKYHFVEAVEEPQSLKLVGDSVENCGPGRSRDRLGICQDDQ